MPNRTPNYNLVKPLQTENYNVDDFNGNMDIVDTQIKDKDTRIKVLEDNKPIVSAKLINLEDRIKVNEQDLTIIKNDLYVNKDLTNVKNSNVINQLTNSKNGMINGLTLQGKTMYKRANGTITDTWESGVSLESSGELLYLKPKNNVPFSNVQIVNVEVLNLYNVKVGDLINWVVTNDVVFKKDIKVTGINGNILTLDLGSQLTGTILTTEKLVPVNPLYKIEILSQGKNLFDEKWEQGHIDSDNGQNTISNTIIRSSNYTLIDNTKTYVISRDIYTQPIGIRYYNSNKSYISPQSISVQNEKLIIPSNAKYLRIVDFNNNFNVKVQLEEGITATTYESYKSDKTEILTTQPLRQWDSIDSNGVINRNSGQSVLNGSSSEVWSKLNALNENNSTLFLIGSIIKIPLNKSIIANLKTDKFITNSSDRSYDTDSECAAVGITGGLQLRVLNSKTGVIKTDADSVKVQKLRTWLNSNPVSLVYELTDNLKTTENTNKTLDLSCYENGSLVVNSGLVNPEINFNYPTSIYGSIFTIADGIGNIRENIEKTFTPKEDTELLTTLVGQIVDTSVKIAQVQNVNATLIKELTDTKIEIVNLKTELSLK